MTNILEVIGASAIVAVVLFLAIIAGTAMGAFGGYILSLTFLGDWIIEGLKTFGYDATGKLTVIGALFGFMSGFFKSSVTNNK